MNATTSELLAAVDLLGIAFDSSKITNLGEALITLRSGALPAGGTRGQALVINAGGNPMWGAPIEGGNF
jgi:hypothetical protein